LGDDVRGCSGSVCVGRVHKETGWGSEAGGKWYKAQITAVGAAKEERRKREAFEQRRKKKKVEPKMVQSLKRGFGEHQKVVRQGQVRMAAKIPKKIDVDKGCCKINESVVAREDRS